MRGILYLLFAIYLVGVGVELAPVVQSRWNNSPASDLAEDIVRALPDALAWPARAYRSLTNQG